ncbi:Thioredoxin domain-containing protein 9-like protein [Diplonema papillatum]|nr:Thioredoxin domain-containing protein 9-like protein [Diplonema papillatum]
MEPMMEQQVIQAAEIIEEQIDREIAEVEKLEEDDLEVIRRKRLQQLKKMKEQKDKWVRKGHGVVQEIASPEDFFKACKDHERVVVHFYREATERCKLLNEHLVKVAPKHWETMFTKVDVEKVPGLAERYNVFMLPTLMLVEGGTTHHSIIGFDEFGGKDNFPTSRFVAVLAHHGMINEKGMFASDQTKDEE